MTAGISKLRLYVEEYAAGESPATPGVGEWALFFRPDGAYTKDDAGTVAGPLGTGGSGISDGDKGDLTVSVGGTVWTIDAGVITLAKMANMATASLLGRSTAGDGAPEILSASTVRTLLDLVVGTNIQAYNSVLSTLAGASANGQSLITAADYAAMKALLDLEIGIDVQAYDADLTAWAGKTAPTGTVLGETDIQTMTNKRITKRVASATDDATAVIDSDSYDEYYLTAVANATEISVAGTPTTGQTIFIGLKDAGVSKALTWTGITALGVTLPTATTAGKQHIIGVKYIASAWRAIAVGVEA